MQSYIHKLWDRGVDIGVGVITSIIIAVIGLVFWKGKLWLDLQADKKKQIQQDRIRRDFEQKERVQNERERYERLTKEREDFATTVQGGTMGKVGHGNHWELVREWMKSNALHHVPANLPRFNELADWQERLRSASDNNVEANARNMAKIIRELEIPKSDEPPQ